MTTAAAPSRPDTLPVSVDFRSAPQQALSIVDVPIEGMDVAGFKLLAPATRQPRTEVWQTIDRFAGQPGVRSLDEYIARDPYPLPDTPDREGYHGQRHFAWWVSGLCDYLQITQNMARHGVPLRRGDQVLDLGCASGRTMRHFACQGDDLTIYGVDIKRSNVDWCTRFLPRNVRPVLGVNVPKLPIADNSLALAYAFSVFTHIDDFETAWLAEIHRVLKPGGVAYLTIHSERLWTRMNTQHPIYNALLRHKDNKEYPVDPEQFKSPMPADRVVFKMGPALHHVNVFHSDRYLHQVWGRFFDIAEIIETNDMVQAEVVLIKR